VVLSAFKQAEDRSSTLVRLFNSGDVEAHAILRTDAAISEAFDVNLLEERQSALPVESGGIELRLGPKRIRTIEIE
jgi:alpha-mannosidase